MIGVIISPYLLVGRLLVYRQQKNQHYMASQHRWLVRRPVTAEVVGSSPIGVAIDSWKDNRRFRCIVVRSIDKDMVVSLYNNNHLYGFIAPIGRASALHAEGCRFESDWIHQSLKQDGRKRANSPHRVYNRRRRTEFVTEPAGWH